MRQLVRFLSVPLLVVALGYFAPHLFAQDAPNATPAPFLALASVDASSFPTMQLTMYGAPTTTALADLPLEVRENEQLQTLVSDETVEGGIQLAVVLDPHDLQTVGASGQSHQAEVTRILLDLIEQEVVVRNTDQLAAFSANSAGELQTIQIWTSEPNLIFNSTVQHQLPAAAADQALTPLLLRVLEQFLAPSERQSPPLVRTLLLFSTGAGEIDAEPLLQRAHAERVHLQIVQLAGAEANNPTALQELAQQTNGVFVRLGQTQDLQPLWQRLTALRQQRTVSYLSTATQAGPLALTVATTDDPPLLAAAELTLDTVDQPPQSAPIAASAATPAEPATPASEPITALPTAAVENLPVAQPAQAVETTDPGAGSTLTRTLLELALPILIVLLAYFAYREIRDRRAQRTQAKRQANEKGFVNSRHYELEGEPQERQPPARRPVRRTPLPDQEDDLEVLEPTPRRPAPPSSALPPASETEDDDDGVTVVPMHFSDDEATYRLRDTVEQPIVGRLVRVSNDPNLPQQLPIYGLSASVGATRRIHIGRHSKNNSVVINDKSISREHAVIIQKEGRLYLSDNASTAGTFLNWRRLKPGEELLLRHNDLISLGEVVYEFHARGEDEATVASE